MALKFIELFAGIGGFRNGLEACNREQQGNSNTGGCGNSIIAKSQQPDEPTERKHYVSVWANEWDKYAASIYRYQYGEICEADIRTVDYASIPDHDLCTFGWPCQDNSIAGGRDGQENGARSSLFNQAIEILRIKKPNYFLAENVPGLFSVSGGYDFYEAIRMFAEVGYDVQWQVLNTRWFLPQNRERIFFIGHLRGQRRPQVFPIGEANQVYSKPDGEIAHAIDSNYHKGWLDNQQRTMVRLRSDEDYRKSSVSPPLRGSDKQEVRIIAPTIRAEHHNTTEAVALRSGASHNYQTVDSIRRLTPKECERLQGLPDDWTKYGRDINGKKLEISDTQRYKACGNGVSTPVITAIGNKLLQAMAFRPGAGEYKT